MSNKELINAVRTRPNMFTSIFGDGIGSASAAFRFIDREGKGTITWPQFREGVPAAVGSMGLDQASSPLEASNARAWQVWSTVRPQLCCLPSTVLFALNYCLPSTVCPHF